MTISKSEADGAIPSLVKRLENTAATSESYFRTCLLKEDIARILRLHNLSQTATDIVAFKAAGLVIGWTPGDTRTWELKPALDLLLDAFYAAASAPNCDSEKTLNTAWDAFDVARVDLLVGCLSRVPKLNDE